MFTKIIVLLNYSLLLLVTLILFAFPMPSTSTFENYIYSIDWNEDGLIAIGKGDGSILVYEEDGNLYETLSINIGPVYTVRWSPDGTRLLASGEGGEVNIWDINIELPTSAPIIIDIDNFTQYWPPIFASDWNNDGMRIAIGTIHPAVNNSVLIYDSMTGSRTRIVSLNNEAESINAVAWSPTENHLAIASSSLAMGAQLIDMDNPTQRIELEDSVDIKVLTWSPLEDLIAGGNGRPWIWDAQTGETLHVVDSNSTTRLTSLSWNSSGTMLVGGFQDGLIEVWDNFGNLLSTYNTLTIGPTSVVWNPITDDIVYVDNANSLMIHSALSGSSSKNPNFAIVDDR